MDNICACGCVKPNSKNKFCSQSCAATFTNKARPKSVYEKRTLTLKKLYGTEDRVKVKTKKNPLISAKKLGIPYTPVSMCSTCKRWFDTSIRNSTSCSDECFISVKILNNRGKVCYNKAGERFDSSWELQLADYMDQLNIRWTRPKDSIPWIDNVGKSHKYFPDFYLEEFGLFLDPKNKHVQKLQEEKISYLLKTYTNIVIGTLDELKEFVARYSIL